ncbi:peptidoglycan-binding protein [Streptomyces sp. NPDC059828]|uniref:peptidoglycan-binding protein n=1 Tax=Streptomyces sp. NPDC059828 TaxID=3346965 RepID=UPI0036614599
MTGPDDNPTVVLAVTRPGADPVAGADTDSGATSAAGSPGRRRRMRIAAAVLVVSLAGAGVAVGVPWGKDGGAKPAGAEPSASTVAVVRMDLSDSRLLEGTLGYAQPRTVKGAGDGVVTWLPAAGTTVSRGKELYRVDDRAVPLFYGGVPLYRRLEGRNMVGRDVRVIVDNLRALGYDVGDQPSPGQVVSVTAPAGEAQSAGSGAGPAADKGAAASPSSASDGAKAGGPGSAAESATGTSRSESTAPGTAAGKSGTPADEGGTSVTQVKVKSGDGVLTDALVNAIKRWQTRIGSPATGVLAPGDAVVLGGAVRVDGASAQVGDAAAAPLLKVTSTVKAATVEMGALEAGSVKRGDPVTVRLPDGTSAPGEVSGVGTAAESSENGPGPAKVTVMVAFTHPHKVKRLDSGPVQVEFVSQKRVGVLAVPVTALLALREGGYGLRIAGGRMVAVKTGLIAKGMVEITGDGISEGARVVTSS